MEVTIHDFVTVSSPRKQELKLATEEFKELQLLQEVIVHGWSTHMKTLLERSWPYWSLGDDLYTQNGLVMMGQRIIIPKSQRHAIMSQIHTGHLGSIKCKLRAKSAAWWPGIYNDIDKTASPCPSCQRSQSAQPKEPIVISPGDGLLQ